MRLRQPGCQRQPISRVSDRGHRKTDRHSFWTKEESNAASNAPYPVSATTVAPLLAHWSGRGLDFDEALAEGPLIAPVVIDRTDASLAKHGDALEGRGAAVHQIHAPYAADALARLVREAARRIPEAMLRKGALSHDAHIKLLRTSAHAFRHIFGTQTVA